MCIPMICDNWRGICRTSLSNVILVLFSRNKKESEGIQHVHVCVHLQSILDRECMFVPALSD